MKIKRSVLSIFGTRPEAIKMAPVIKELEHHSDIFNSRICVTGQHRHMLDQVLELFDIRPDFDLDIMKYSQDLFDISSSVLCRLKEDVLLVEKPDIILVHGDTTTSMIASLAAYYLKIQVGHIEAGLRTKDKYSPFPEEVNRRITGVIADIHFAPTIEAKQNLLTEGVADQAIYVTGNTSIDALHSIKNRIDLECLDASIFNKIVSRYPDLKILSNKSTRLILVTGHRRENFGTGLQNICNAINKLVKLYDNVEVIYSAHLNPNVQSCVNKILNNSKNIHIIEPVDYLTFVWLMNRSYFVLTDSGGIQEEAPALGKPVLVTRFKTERPEGISTGAARLIGTDASYVLRAMQQLLDDQGHYLEMSLATSPYGDGRAAVKIVNCLKKLLDCAG